MNIRPYNPETDYPLLFELLNREGTFGGVFDPARDSERKIQQLVNEKPDCLWVAYLQGVMVGTVSVFEDGRACWLYRFACSDESAVGPLWDKARSVARKRGHQQVLVYGPVGGVAYEDRYRDIGFTKGNDYTAYWQEI